MRSVPGPFTVATYHTLRIVSYTLVDAGRTDEALPLALDAVDRGCRVYGPSAIDVSHSIGTVNTLLRQRGDFAALRDFHEHLLGAVLSIPVEPVPYLLDRRRIRLAHSLRALANLPGEVPVDVDLAVRAAKEITRLDGGKLRRPHPRSPLRSRRPTRSRRAGLRECQGGGQLFGQGK